MVPMMPSWIKGTHAFYASNASIGAVHTFSEAVSKAPVGESSGQACQQPTPPLHTFKGEADPESYIYILIIMAPCPIYLHCLFIILHPHTANTSNSNNHKPSALDAMISTSGGGNNTIWAGCVEYCGCSAW